MIEFTVWGDPKSQGSMRAVTNPHTGRAVALHDSPKTKPWRQEVAGAALHAGVRELAGGVALTLTFYFIRPKTVKRPLPNVKPDIDKLERAILDALTGIAYRDDAQVTSVAKVKRYGSRACCVIRIEEDIDEEQLAY